MTLVEKLFDLKYRKGVPTHQLRHRFPEHMELVSEVALLEIPEGTLKALALEKELLERLASLRKTIAKSSPQHHRQKKAAL